jgi:hypothetical protein
MWRKSSKIMSENPEKIVVFHYFDNAIDANIAKTKLDAYGIPCFLTEENMAGLYPGQNFNAFKVRLHLFAADRERAAHLLEGEPVDEDEERSPICPACRSMRTERAFPAKVADTLLYVLFGILLPHKKVNRCLDCGNEF